MEYYERKTRREAKKYFVINKRLRGERRSGEKKEKYLKSISGV